MPKRILQGEVVANNNDKTVTVLVERRVRNPLYKKVVRRSKKFMAHDEQNRVSVGDVVRIRECRPLSKRKHFEVLDEGKGGNS